jgi:glycoprotein 3-alpha-L-fucosyltransferase
MIITKGNVASLLKQYPNRTESPIVVWYQLESPMNVWSPDLANWTATYRRDSTLNAPYYKFASYENAELIKRSTRNYALGKTKKVAWFVSNCQAVNGRMNYANELAKYIDVDIYGKCGKLRCSRKQHDDKCVKLLNKDYKFYLSFENSHCKDYITEKFFANGLS